MKKLVEEQKMELSDGKITASEWNSVMDKLAEIQQNRKANGQASIFSGGTDKTRAGWQNSFVVHPGQEIEFTAEEISELYDAMGAKFTSKAPAAPNAEPKTPAASPDSASVTVPEQTPAPKPVPEPAQNVATTNVAEENVPKKDENTPVTDTNLPSKGQDVSQYTLENREYIFPNKMLANRTVKNPDGTSYSYNKDGYLEAVLDQNGNKTRAIFRDSGFNVDFYIDYEYDENGNRTQATYRESDGSVADYTEYKYDEKGNRTRTIRHNPDGSVR